MSSSCVVALERLCKYLASAPPRELHVDFPAPLLLFTDGAVEPAPGQPDLLVASVGACFLDPISLQYLFFGAPVPRNIVDEWCASGAKQVITEAELLPIYLARVVFAKFFAKRPFISFIDNDAAMACMVRGTSSKAACAKIVGAIVRRDLLDGALA